EHEPEKALSRNEISRLVQHSFAPADPAMLRQANGRQEKPPSIVEQSSKVNETILTELLTKNDPTLQDINALSLAQRDQNISPATPHSHSDPVRSTSTPPQPSSQEQDHDIDLLH